MAQTAQGRDRLVQFFARPLEQVAERLGEVRRFAVVLAKEAQALL